MEGLVMKKKFFEAIRELFGFEVSSVEPQVSGDLSEVGKWQAKVSDRCYNKDDLVYFVQYGHEKNEDNIYFMCGYLNADGTRFRDLSTGAVYGVFDAPYPDRNTMIGESMHSTISYGNSSFVRVEPEVVRLHDLCFTRWINVGIAGTALASTGHLFLSGMDNGIVLSETLKNKNGYEYIVAPALYRLITKDYGLASGEDILGAVKQANMCCIDNVNKEAERRQRSAECGQDAPIKDASLTPKELDF
jgi:hypothetical protein